MAAIPSENKNSLFQSINQSISAAAFRAIAQCPQSVVPMPGTVRGAFFECAHYDMVDYISPESNWGCCANEQNGAAPLS